MVVSKVYLADTDEERLACFPVLHQLRPHLKEEAFLTQLERQRARGYRLAYTLADDEGADGQVAAVTGFDVGESLAWGKHLYVYDLVTDEGHRSQGHGEALIEFLRSYALEQGCQLLHLDSGVQRFGAHKFYMREGFHISSYHFGLEVTP